MPPHDRIRRGVAAVLAGCSTWTGLGLDRAAAQEPAPPLPVPSPALPTGLPEVPALPEGEPSPAELLEQVRRLEQLLRAGMDRQAELESRIIELESGARVAPGPAAAAGSAPSWSAGPAAGAAPGGPTGAPTPGPGYGEREVTRGGSAGLAPGAPPPSGANMPAPPRARSGRFDLSQGFQFASDDEEYTFQFHNLTQVDGRFYEQGGQQYTRDTFGLPRQWFIFSGRMTRPFEYYLAINQGFNNINLLDAYLNIRYDDRLQLRAGRYKTPFTYEFYSLPIQGLITPERSQFFNNFGLNRSVGLMAWGLLFDQRADYAVGIFNNSRNGFLNVDNSFDVAALFNIRPFAFFDVPALRYFNVGGSVDAGHENEPRLPPVLRLNVPTQAPDAIGVPFLAYTPGTLESGTRALWSLHAAWYYRQLSLIAEWQSGYESNALPDRPTRSTQVPVGSYYVQAGYFLTGETVTTRGTVEPIRPFDIRPGRRGPGAVELALRYNLLEVSERIFTAGFSDPNLWSNRVQSIDVGINWYLTREVKLWAGWQHSIFGSPVLFDVDPNRFQLTSDLFWVRFQLFF